MTGVQRRFIQAGVLAVVVLACVAEALSLTILPDRLEWRLSLESGPPWSFVVAIVPGSSFVLSGLIAWSLRPRNRVGLLMMGVGVGLLIGGAGPHSPSAFSETLSQIAFPWGEIALLA